MLSGGLIRCAAGVWRAAGVGRIGVSDWVQARGRRRGAWARGARRAVGGRGQIRHAEGVLVALGRGGQVGVVRSVAVGWCSATERDSKEIGLERGVELQIERLSKRNCADGKKELQQQRLRDKG